MAGLSDPKDVKKYQNIKVYPVIIIVRLEHTVLVRTTVKFVASVETRSQARVLNPC